MNEKELQNIWNKFTNKFDISQLGLDYEKFKLKMDTTDKRKRFFDKYSQSLGLGDYENFEKSISQLSPQPSNTNQPLKPAQTVDSSVFNCIKNSRGWGSKLASKSDEPNAYSFLNDVQSEFVFFGDGKFYIQLNSGEKMFGTWKCKGQSSYEIEINNTDFNKKQYFRSETSQWADRQNAAALEENFIKKIVTKHLRSKL